MVSHCVCAFEFGSLGGIVVAANRTTVVLQCYPNSNIIATDIISSPESWLGGHDVRCVVRSSMNPARRARIARVHQRVRPVLLLVVLWALATPMLRSACAACGQRHCCAQPAVNVRSLAGCSLRRLRCAAWSTNRRRRFPYRRRATRRTSGAAGHSSVPTSRPTSTHIPRAAASVSASVASMALSTPARYTPPLPRCRLIRLCPLERVVWRFALIGLS